MTKKTKIAIFAIIVLVSLTLGFAGGCTVDIFKPTTTQTKADLNYDLIKEAYKVILKDYVEPDKIDANKLTEGAIRGMVQAINDPYSAYLTQDEYKMSVSDFAGSFEGIGAYVDSQSGRIIIIAPIPNTPADKAGILPGDAILEIDGKTTANMNTTDAVSLIRGAHGTKVKLTILHKDAATPVILEIVRAEIKLPTVSLEMKETIAVITITHFTELTDDELTVVLKDPSVTSAKGIIIDLRNNPGGILETVIKDASHFLDDGIVVSVVYPDGQKQTSSVKGVSPKIDLPMVILVNQYSASGSEVLSGALQDHKRAVIAGQKTYGKGSVDMLVRLSDGSGIYLTIARWLTPNGNLIEGKGIQPDYEVDFDKVDGIQWAIDYFNTSK